MSANLYETKEQGRYYHIHGSLEANTTLEMIGLEPFRPDLQNHDEIVRVIEPAVQRFTVQQLEDLNAKHRQAGVEALKHEDFIKTPHVSNSNFQHRLTLISISGTYEYKTASLEHLVSRKSMPASTFATRFIRKATCSRRHQGPRIVPHYRWTDSSSYSRRVWCGCSQSHESKPQ